MSLLLIVYYCMLVSIPICLHVCMSYCLSVCHVLYSFCLFVCLQACQQVYLIVSLSTSVSPFSCPPIHFSVCMSMNRSVCQTRFYFNIVVPLGTVTQQPMFSQELLSLHDKFLAPKPRQNSKKRKRGDYGGGKTVWMSKDLDCMPNAVQSLPIQGQLNILRYS